MVLVPVGEHDAVDVVGPLAQKREVRQHEVDPGHLGVGEHHPAVEDDEPAVLLENRAVAADLPEPAEEGDPDRLRHAWLATPLRASRLERHDSRLASIEPASARATPGPVPSEAGTRPPGGRAARSTALAGIGFGASSLGLERDRVEQRGVQLPGALDVAVEEAADHLAELLRRPSATRRSRRRRRRPPAAEGSAGRRRCSSRSPAPASATSRAVPAGLPDASFTPTMLGTSRHELQHRLEVDLAPRADRDVVER